MKTTKTYNGRPCKSCGATLRYSSTCACVACAIKKGLEKHYKSMGKIFTGVELTQQQISILNRDEAKEKGKRYYHGMSCKHCGNTMKYVTTRSCVSCTIDRAKNAQKRKVSKQKTT